MIPVAFMEATESNNGEDHQESNNHPSLGENEEEYLRSTWGKLGVGQDGYLDQTQLALVCECIGMEKLSDEVIAQLFDKLDLDHDGRISFGEFLHLFQNVRPGKNEPQVESENYQQHSPNHWGVITSTGINRNSASSEMLMMPSQTTMALFTSIDPAGTGFATFEATVECLRSMGLSQASSLLEALSFSNPPQRVNLRDLVGALQEEMNAGLDAGLLATIGHSGIALHAGVLLLTHELSSVRLTVEHVSRECEKLRSDLQEANQRSSLLAQEVDENHAKQELILRSQFKQLEQRHADQLRLVQEVAQAERDQMVSQLQRELEKRQQQLQQVKEEEGRLKDQIVNLSEDNARLSADNANLTEKLASSERANGRLIRELDGVSLMAELESRCEALEESQRNSLTEQLNRLSAENLQLRDRTDELSAEVEQLRGQLALAKTEFSKAGLSPAWRSEPTVSSGAVKRRSEANGESVIGDEDDPTIHEATNPAGKVRKREADGLNGSLLSKSLSSPEESPRPVNHDNNQNGWGDCGTDAELQTLAAQLEEAKQLNNQGTSVGSASTIKEQLKRVFEKLRLQIVEEFLEGNDSVAKLQDQYRSVLMQQEERHGDEKRSLIESHLLKLSALEAQLVEAQIRCEDLVQLQTVMEAEHEMEVKDLRQQLKRIHVKDSKQEDYENLTEALADLDAALDKELDREENMDDQLSQLQDENPNKVEELEKQCKTLEYELDGVKDEIVKILRDNEDLRAKVKKQQEELELEQKEADERMEEKVEYETAILQQRIKHLTKEAEEERKRNNLERNALEEDRRDLESRLDMLRAEFDRLDEYWQTKMDEERALYDQERDSTDERFRAFEDKIKEYEELLAQSDGSSTSSLSTIEERTNWEKQLNDLEEENQANLEQIARLELELEKVRQEHFNERHDMLEERDQLSADLESTKLLLAEAVEREGKVVLQLEQFRSNNASGLSSPSKSVSRSTSPSLNRPLSPTPKPGLLPSGYSPLKSKGWAKSQRSSPPIKPAESALDAADGRKMPMPRSPSLSSTSSDQRFCRVDISVFQALNTRLKQQEQRCRELYYALQQQKQRTEQILLETKIQHHEEINSLELMMKASQETLHQMSLKHQQTLDKLSSSDLLIMDLYTENAHLLQALHMHQNASANNPSTSGLSM